MASSSSSPLSSPQKKKKSPCLGSASAAAAAAAATEADLETAICLQLGPSTTDTAIKEIRPKCEDVTMETMDLHLGTGDRNPRSSSSPNPNPNPNPNPSSKPSANSNPNPNPSPNLNARGGEEDGLGAVQEEERAGGKVGVRVGTGTGTGIGALGGGGGGRKRKSELLEKTSFGHWKEPWVVQLCHIRGAMQPEFSSPPKRGVDLWYNVYAKLLARCPDFDRDSEACRKKWRNVFKKYKTATGLATAHDQVQACKHYSIIDLYMCCAKTGNSTTTAGNNNNNMPVPGAPTPAGRYARKNTPPRPHPHPPPPTLPTSICFGQESANTICFAREAPNGDHNSISYTLAKDDRISTRACFTQERATQSPICFTPDLPQASNMVCYAAPMNFLCYALNGDQAMSSTVKETSGKTHNTSSPSTLRGGQQQQQPHSSFSVTDNIKSQPQPQPQQQQAASPPAPLPLKQVTENLNPSPDTAPPAPPSLESTMAMMSRMVAAVENMGARIISSIEEQSHIETQKLQVLRGISDSLKDMVKIVDGQSQNHVGHR